METALHSVGKQPQGGEKHPKFKAGEPEVKTAVTLTATSNTWESETTYWNNKVLCKKKIS